MKKLIIYIIISAMFAFIVTYIFNIYSKDKFTSTIKISPLHQSESVLLNLINMKLKSNAMDNVVKFFSSKLNNRVYNTQNGCTKINKINNVVPLIISYSQTQINIEMTSYDENSIARCREFIIKEMENENKRIVNFYKTILKSTSSKEIAGELSRENSEFNLKELRERYSSLQKEIINDDNSKEKLTQSQILSMLYQYQLMSLLYKDLTLSDMSVDLKLVDELKYFKINFDKTTIHKKLNTYFLYISFFISIFLTIVVFNKVKNKKSLIIKKVEKFLS